MQQSQKTEYKIFHKPASQLRFSFCYWFTLMAENIVKVNEVTRVTPLADPSSTKTALFTLPLTYLDIYWFKVLPVERLFFYQAEPWRYKEA